MSVTSSMKLFNIRSRVYIALSLFFGLITFGSLGYMLLADFSLVDAIYMTVITVSTVGFKEVQPLEFSSKIFTIFLILTSITIYGYVISVLTEYISNTKLLEELKLKKVQNKIDKLTGHVIVCGYGRNGKQAVTTLTSHGKNVVVIENEVEFINEIDLDNNLHFIKGDATDDEVLLKAGIKKAGNLITALPSDANNLYVVLSARQLNNKCTIISRAANESSYHKLKIAGADNVIMPTKLGGAHMATLVVTPDVIEFIDRISIEGESSSNIEELVIENLPEEYKNKSILDLDLRKKTGCTVIGFKMPNKEYVINPDANMKLVPNSKLIVIGSPDQIKKLNELF
ncbi:MAG: potassium channel protein [Bacteroidota bacterium]